MIYRKLVGFQVVDGRGNHLMGEGPSQLTSHPSWSVIPVEAAALAALQLGRNEALIPVFDGDIAGPGGHTQEGEIAFIAFPDLDTSFQNSRENLIAETAACLWEEAERLRSSRDDTPVRQTLEKVRAEIGAVALRQAVIGMAPACHAAWEALDPDAQDEASPFDWQFVPAWFSTQVEQGGLAT